MSADVAHVFEGPNTNEMRAIGLSIPALTQMCTYTQRLSCRITFIVLRTSTVL